MMEITKKIDVTIRALTTDATKCDDECPWFSGEWYMCKLFDRVLTFTDSDHFVRCLECEAKFGNCTESAQSKAVAEPVTKTEAERLRDAAVGEIVTLDDGRSVRVVEWDLSDYPCPKCALNDNHSCEEFVCHPMSRRNGESVYFKEVRDE